MRRACASALHAPELERGWQPAPARRLERHARDPPGSRACERTVAFLRSPPFALLAGVASERGRGARRAAAVRARPGLRTEPPEHGRSSSQQLDRAAPAQPTGIRLLRVGLRAPPLQGEPRRAGDKDDWRRAGARLCADICRWDQRAAPSHSAASRPCQFGRTLLSVWSHVSLVAVSLVAF